MIDQASTRTSRELLAAAAATSAATAERAGIAVRPLETLEQMIVACQVLEQVWQIRPGQAFDVQPHLLRALGHGGNYLAGAYSADDGRLLAASAGFFTEPLGAAMHSHITGVLPEAAGRGVGACIKWHQRQWALERGLSRITWTYDPLIARNSFFNLTRLGARPETYFVDFYGLMDDGPNRGQPSDRVEVIWDLTGESTVAAEHATRHGHPGRAPDIQALMAAGATVVLGVGPGDAPVPGRPPVSGRPPASGPGPLLIGIPPDIEELRRSRPRLALAWRHELRAALALLLADTSWQVTGFARPGWYLLERRAPA